MKYEKSVKVLQQLLRNSRKSDREHAKTIGVSQPTFSRIRNQLEKKVIRGYSISPDLHELGFEMLAFTFLRIENPKPEHLEKARQQGRQNPNVVFAALGEGLGMHSVIVSVHNDYAQYHNFLRQMKNDWAGVVAEVQSFIVSLHADAIAKSFSMKYLADILPKEPPKEPQ